MEKISILFVEDDPYLGLILSDFLESKGYKVYYNDNAEKGLNTYKNNSVDLCLLDVSLPGKDGFTLAREIKNIDKDVPLLFLTAQSEKEAVMKGFDLGADDYIRKPFLPDEVYVRIRSVLRRLHRETKNTGTVLNIGKYIFDYTSQTLKYVDSDAILSHKESELLKLLYENKNEIVPKETIYRKVWESKDLGLSRSVDVYITKLRKLLKHDENIQIINERGIGYKMFINS
jgi:DNA-binding response OmpR family regulator